MIEQSGVTSIAEALRLAPGLMVQQQTNGNYAVHLRQNAIGFNGQLQDSQNQQLMVVIDHVPQYDYCLGGILWEALPVDMHDIERIEVIRTPSAVFFGSTAITGVIHIFTKQVKDNELKVTLESQMGTSAAQLKDKRYDLSRMYRGALSFGLSDKWRFRMSGHYHFMNRFQKPYFLLNENRYIASDSLLFVKQNAAQTNLNTQLGKKSMGLNAFTFYKPSDKVLITTQVNFQNSHAQVIQTDDTLALAQRASNTYGLSINAHVYDFHVNVSRHQGERNYALGYTGNHTMLAQTQASLVYRWALKQAQIQSGAGFLQAENTPIGSNLTVNTVGYHAFVKADAAPLTGWRVMASIRGDQYEQSAAPYLSYQISSSVRLKKHLIRGSYTYNEGIPLGRQLPGRLIHTLLPSTKPHQVQSSEIGWNTRIAARIKTSLEAFYQQWRVSPAYMSADLAATEAQTNISQAGASGRVQVWLNKLQLEGFVTVQRSGENLAQLQSNPLQNTPQIYGGMTLNYTGLMGRLNANVQLYFYEQHQLNTMYGNQVMPARTLLNLMLSYKVWRESRLFLNARNLLNATQKEYAFADDVSGMYLLGLRINI
jgi:iron complex outermembrane receptor protein